MAISRTKSRKKIVIILYQLLLYKKNKISFDIDEIINLNMEENDDYIEKVIKNIMDKYEEYVSLANKYLNTWPMDRLGLTDQSIILLAIYELLNIEEEPALYINEAVELAKVYSDDSVSKIINAALDKIYHNEVKK